MDGPRELTAADIGGVEDTPEQLAAREAARERAAQQYAAGSGKSIEEARAVLERAAPESSDAQRRRQSSRPPPFAGLDQLRLFEPEPPPATPRERFG